MATKSPPFSESAATLARHIGLAAQWGLDDIALSSTPNANASQRQPSRSTADAMPAAQDINFNLDPFADVLGHNCATPTGPFGLPVRLLRRCFKIVMGPWLQKQTLFNQALVRSWLQEQASSRGCLERLDEQVRTLEDQLREAATLLKSLRLNQRLALRHVVETLERAAPRQQPADAGNHPLSEQVVSQVFLQKWLPPPPAKVLIWDDAMSDVHGLSALGYQLVTSCGSAELSNLGSLDGELDAIVSLGRPLTGQPLFGDQRALRHGGRVIGKLTHPDSEGAVLQLIGFRLLEVACKSETGLAWTYRRDISMSEALRVCGTADSVALIAAEKN